MKWVEDKDMVLWNQRAAARNTMYDRANSEMPEAVPEKVMKKKKKPRKVKKILHGLRKLKKVRTQAELCLRVSRIKM